MDNGINFHLSDRVEGFRARIRDFVTERILPLEADPSSYDDHENIRPNLLDTHRAEARKAGLWCLQLPPELGGQGLGLAGMAPCYEEFGRSIFGPPVFNGAAPDDGNMMVLAKVARPDQQERWLKPIVEGRVKSSFVMTEPMPGSGSDPRAMLTRADRKGSGWVVTGRKWFITGAGVAQHFILLARTSDDPRRGISAFLFDRDQPGFRIVRRIPIMGPEEHGGHCELEFGGLEIPEENLLMKVGDGLKLAQIRLGPARLTHCMRWLGLAKRSLEIAAEYIQERRNGSLTLAERDGVQWMMGEAAMHIQIGRLLTMNAAWKIDQGDRARAEVSMAKVAVADLLHKSADTAIQLCGARGYSKDTVLEWIYRYARQARLVDGASEVHKTLLSQAFLEQGLGFWRWGV